MVTILTIGLMSHSDALMPKIYELKQSSTTLRKKLNTSQEHSVVQWLGTVLRGKKLHLVLATDAERSGPW